MSTKILNRVWESTRITNSSQRLLLVALADSSNDDGHSFPGLNHLIRKTQLSRSGVKKNIKTLVDKKEIYQFTSGGKGPSHKGSYLVLTGQDQSQIEHLKNYYKNFNTRIGKGSLSDPLPKKQKSLISHSNNCNKPDILPTPSNQSDQKNGKGSLSDPLQEDLRGHSEQEKGVTLSKKRGHFQRLICLDLIQTIMRSPTDP